MDGQDSLGRPGNFLEAINGFFPPGKVYVFSDRGFTVLHKCTGGKITTTDCSTTTVEDIGAAIERALADGQTVGFVASSDAVIDYLGATGRFVPDDELRVGVVYDYRRGRQEGGCKDLEWAFVTL